MKKTVVIITFFAVLVLNALTLMLGSGAAVAARTSCKFETKAWDRYAVDVTTERSPTQSIVGQIIVATKWADLSHPARPSGREMSGFVSAVYRGGDKFLRVRIEYFRSKKTFPTSDDDIRVPADGEMLIGMADGSVVKVYATNQDIDLRVETRFSRSVMAALDIDTPKPYSGKPFWMMSYLTVEYALDAEAEAALMATGARAIRIQTDKGPLDVRIYKGSSNYIQKAVNCIAALQGPVFNDTFDEIHQKELKAQRARDRRMAKGLDIAELVSDEARKKKQEQADIVLARMNANNSAGGEQ